MTKLKNQWRFNSIAELMEELDNSEKIPGRKTSSEKSDGYNGVDTNSYDEARMYMLEGKMYDELGADIDKYRTKGTSTKRASHLSVVGHNVVVPLYLQGVPNNMITKKTVINNKIITIFYYISVPYYVSDREIFNNAIQLFKNIISLEEQGYRVNLYIMDCDRQNGQDTGFAVKLKTDREVLNIKKLCFPLVSPSMLRRIGFRVIERLYKEDSTHNGYGSGRFDREQVERFIQNTFRIKRYEVWNYEGKQI